MNVSLSVGSIRSVDLSTLSPGDLFFQIRGGARHICMAVLPHRQDYCCYMVLSAATFELIDIAASHARPVTVLGLNSKDLFVRFDPMEKVEALDSPNALGVLQIPREGRPQILGAYSDLKDEPFRSAVNLHDGTVERADGPYIGFRSWKLSYVDPVGQWVDLCAQG